MKFKQILLIIFTAFFVAEIFYIKDIYLGMEEAFKSSWFDGFLVTIGVCIPFTGMVVMFIQNLEDK